MYSRKELGSIYFPWFKEPRASSRALTRTIYSDGELLTRLEEVGFRKGLRYLSPQMVMILAQYLGDPTLFHEIHKA